MNDLTQSTVDRQSLLNNSYAVQKMQTDLGLRGILWHGEPVFIKPQVASLLDVDERTIDRYLQQHAEELARNGYNLLRGKKLKEIKDLIYVDDIYVASKTTQLGIFTFRAVLNIAMLLTESDTARWMRTRLLDIAIDVIAERTGGHTKYINQRDEGYLLSDFQQKKYRKAYIKALDDHVVDFRFKNQTYTNKIYQAIFKENAREYRRILQLEDKENVRDTMYCEVLDIIASFENGLAYDIAQKALALGRKLESSELKTVFDTFVNHPQHEPLILKARTQMASRDHHFRAAYHDKLATYIQSVSSQDFEKFLGEKSIELERQIRETQDVFKRLKDR